MPGARDRVEAHAGREGANHSPGMPRAPAVWVDPPAGRASAVGEQQFRTPGDVRLQLANGSAERGVPGVEVEKIPQSGSLPGDLADRGGQTAHL